jgi:hypothetical protein
LQKAYGGTVVDKELSQKGATLGGVDANVGRLQDYRTHHWWFFREEQVSVDAGSH